MSANKLLENLKKDKEKNSGKYQKSSRPKREVMNNEGEFEQRLLPNKTDESDIPYIRLFLHFGFTHPNFGTPSTFRCLGKGCPLCREAKEMQAEQKSDAWKYKSTPVYLYYIADSNDNFKYIRLSQTAHTAVYEELMKKAASQVNPLDMEKGRMAVIKLEKVQLQNGNKKNQWTCTFKNEVDKVSDQIRKELKSAPDLEELYKIYSAEELEKILRGEKLNEYSSSSRTQASEPKKTFNSVIEEESNDLDEDSSPSVMHSAPVDEDDPTPPAEEEDVEKKRADVRARIQREMNSGKK